MTNKIDIIKSRSVKKTDSLSDKHNQELNEIHDRLLNSMGVPKTFFQLTM